MAEEFKFTQEVEKSIRRDPTVGASIARQIEAGEIVMSVTDEEAFRLLMSQAAQDFANSMLMEQS